MIRRIRSLLFFLFFGHLFLGLLLLQLLTAARGAATVGATDEQTLNDDIISTPRFVLVEEHHHVVPHLVRFAREGFLRSHSTRRSQEMERNPHGAILLHIDSHADMGLTPGLNRLPAKALFSNLPLENTDQDMELLEHSLINDFLLLLGYMGIVEHIIFVEPPWSSLLEEAHHTTVDISIGVVPGDDQNEEMGVTYASIRNSPSTTFETFLSEEAVEALDSMMADSFEPVEIVPHEELLHHCLTESDHCNLRTVRFTTLPYQGAAEAIQSLLETKENKGRDIVLDVDLDGFSTTSPGAISLLQTAIPDYEVLSRIYHTVHDGMCDMEKEYWEGLKTSGGSGSQSCESKTMSLVHGLPFEPPQLNDGGSPPAHKSPFARSQELVEELFFHYKMEDDAVQALAEVFEYYLPQVIDSSLYGEEKFVELMNNFLLQPFYVPESQTIEPILDFHFDHLFQTIFENHRPKVINVVRSPFYTPDHHLNAIECQVFDRLLDMFGRKESRAWSNSILYHSDEVRVDRTNCLHESNKFPPPHRFSIGTNPHIETDQFKLTSKTYSWFFEDDDEIVGNDYKFDDISVDFVNEHKEALRVETNDSEILHVLPGQRLTTEVPHLTRWELFKAETREGSATGKSKQPKEAPLLTILFNGKNGDKQSYGSISGRIPVHHSTPVKMRVENPSDSGIHIALKAAPSNDDFDGRIEESLLSPGEEKILRTVHGKRWTIHDVSGEVYTESNNEAPKLGEVIANATFGETHSVLLFSDTNESGNEL